VLARSCFLQNYFPGCYRITLVYESRERNNKELEREIFGALMSGAAAILWMKDVEKGWG